MDSPVYGALLGQFRKKVFDKRKHMADGTKERKKRKREKINH